MTIELKDTVEMMNSKDFKERFCAEYFQTKIRYEKLRALLRKWDAGSWTISEEKEKDKEYQFLGFKPTCPECLLSNQLDQMDRLLKTYETRAVIEGIDLHEYECILNEEALKEKAQNEAIKKTIENTSSGLNDIILAQLNKR